jgi:hypothetical protein
LLLLVIFLLVTAAVGHCSCWSFSCWSLLLLVFGPVGHCCCWSLFLLLVFLLVVAPVGYFPVGHCGPTGNLSLVVFVATTSQLHFVYLSLGLRGFEMYVSGVGSLETSQTDVSEFGNVRNARFGNPEHPKRMFWELGTSQTNVSGVGNVPNRRFGSWSLFLLVNFLLVTAAVGHCSCCSFSYRSSVLTVIVPVCHCCCWSLFLLVIFLLVIVAVGHCPDGHFPVGHGSCWSLFLPCWSRLLLVTFLLVIVAAVAC